MEHERSVVRGFRFYSDLTDIFVALNPTYMKLLIIEDERTLSKNITTSRPTPTISPSKYKSQSFTQPRHKPANHRPEFEEWRAQFKIQHYSINPYPYPERDLRCFPYSPIF